MNHLYKEIGSCIWLTPFGTEFRYPGEYPKVSLEIAEKAFKEANLVKKTVLKKLEEYLSKGRPEK